MVWRPGHADLPGVIALFPLPGALLLPRTSLPLHVFEPRYLAMVEEALKTPHRLIGMISTIGAPAADPQPADARLAAIGCAGRITRFAEMDDGRMMITLSGISRFRLGREVGGFAPWRRAEAGWADFARDLGPVEEDPGLDRDRFLALAGRYLALRNLSVDTGALSRARAEDMVNALSMLCPFPPEDKQALLESPDLGARRETLAALFEYALRGGNSSDTVVQ